MSDVNEPDDDPKKEGNNDNEATGILFLLAVVFTASGISVKFGIGEGLLFTGSAFGLLFFLKMI